MRLRRLEVERFRGIRQLDWRKIGVTAAIVGPGDSGKSSVLDAIERVLSPRWNLAFDDTDFWMLETTHPIVIRATLTDLPEHFYRDTKFGLYLQGFDEDQGVAVAPTGEAEQASALVIELTVEASLEPQWNVINSDGEKRTIQARDREALGMLRVGAYVDQHLGWSRGSVLARLTSEGDDGDGDAVGAALANVARQARASLQLDDLGQLASTAKLVEEAGRNIGVNHAAGLSPHLDAGALSVATGALGLHDGAVPVRRAGLGTRRLLTIAMQRESSKEQGITVVDEFEHGLEPHRIRRLLRVLRGKPPEAAATGGQLVLTTHSPTVLSELDPKEIYVARRGSDGVMTVAHLPDAIDFVLKRVPSALLAAKVVVAEGATEEGICLALDEAWTEELSGTSFAYRGVSVVYGHGSNQPANTAKFLIQLGYGAAIFVDSDSNDQAGRAVGATVLRWPGDGDGASSEQRIALDLPLDGLREMIQLAVSSSKSHDAKAVRNAVVAKLQAAGVQATDAEFDPDAPADWPLRVDEAAFRAAFGLAAKNSKWFKDRHEGHRLGQLVARHWTALANTPTRKVLEGLREFAHGV